MSTSHIKICSQNVSRSQLGETRRGGNIAPLRLFVNHEKPDLIILSEICEDAAFAGLNVFKGYQMTQLSRDPAMLRRGGLSVFCKKNSLECITQSVFNSNSGHFSVALYIYGKNKIIVLAIYGPSTSSDGEAYAVYTEALDKVREYSQLYSTRLIIIGGDFNLNFDKTRSSKHNTVMLFKRFIAEFDLLDAGSELKEATWRRPHLPRSASRIDYHILSRDFDIKKFYIKFTRFDHALLCTELSYNHLLNSRPILKDWSLASTMFQEQASQLMQNILIENDLQLRHSNNEQREQFINDRKTYEYEHELQLVYRKNGIFYSHILLRVIEKLTHLQKRVQNKLKFQRKASLEKLAKELSILYKRIDNLPTGHPSINLITEQIIELKNKIRDDSDMIENAGRLRISNFYESTAGKNVARIVKKGNVSKS